MWADVTAILQRGVAEGLFPGAALCVRSASAELFSVALGQAELRPVPRPVQPETPWDLASLTKVLCAAPLAMHMVARGALDLDEPIRQRLPHAPLGVTAAHCLSHSSGLPAWRPLFEDFPNQEAWGTGPLRELALGVAIGAPIQAPPGEAYAYSDLGMMLLCALMEHIGGVRVDALWRQQLGPWLPGLRWASRERIDAAAATEDCPVRGRVLRGEVHDLNTAVLGGASTHAGLFGSARAVAAAAAWQLRAWLGEDGEGLSPAVVQHFWSYAGGAGSHRLGWDGVTPGASTAGGDWPLDGVGHTGFTGGVLWVAPRQQIVAALCTNRVHPVVEGGARPGATGPRTVAFRALRPELFTAIVAALRAGGQWRE